MQCAKAFTITVFDCTGFITSSDVLPDGQISTPYSTFLTTGPSVGSVTWGIIGSLPPGLTLNALSGEISGTPTGVSASYGFTVSAQDDVKDCQQDCTIIINVPAVCGGRPTEPGTLPWVQTPAPTNMSGTITYPNFTGTMVALPPAGASCRFTPNVALCNPDTPLFVNVVCDVNFTGVAAFDQEIFNLGIADGIQADVQASEFIAGNAIRHYDITMTIPAGQLNYTLNVYFLIFHMLGAPNFTATGVITIFR